MQILVEILSSLIAMLAAAALSQFGVEMHAQKSPEPEIERVQNCPTAPASSIVVKPVQPC